MRAYGIIPIDFGWEYLPTVEDIAHKFATNDATLKIEGVDYEPEMLPGFLERFALAKEAAIAEGWEGDFRGKARVFFLPGENDFHYGFVWKQDNNGTTFVVSPHSLPWLDKLG